MFVVHHQYIVYLVLVHRFLNLGNLRLRTNHLWRTCHNVSYGAVEELCLPFFHSPADVAVSDETDNVAIVYCDTQSQIPLAHV